MTRLLICNAAGCTNLGDDAILLGMLGQLRSESPGASFAAAGGPHLAQLLREEGMEEVKAISHDDAAALARAIEEASLVVIGGGGLFYDHTYRADLARLLEERPDRQWLFHFARIAAAAKAARKPVMLYGVGVGPLLSEAARGTMSWLAQQVEAITVRDLPSREALLGLGVARERVKLAADPALAFHPGEQPPARPQASREGRGARIAVNLRPWFAFETIGRDDRKMEALLAAVAGAAARLSRQAGASFVFVSLQRSPEDDGAIGRRLQEAAPGCELASPASPSQAQALLAGCDLLLGMRLHSLIFAAKAGMPFLALDYDPKVRAFAESVGMEEWRLPVEDLEPAELAGKCLSLLERSADTSEALGRRVKQLEERAAVSAEVAAELLGRREEKATGLAAPSPRIEQRRELRVLMQMRPDYESVPGGDSYQMRHTREALRAEGVQVDVSTELRPRLEGYDLVHVFNLTRPAESYEHCLNALEQGKPIALSTIYWSQEEFWQWVDTDYWELPPPGEGEIRPQPVPAGEIPGSVRRERERWVAQARTLLEWADVCLPNSEMEAELILRDLGGERERFLVVPNAVGPPFFEANPEEFVETHGVRDFVLCVGRVEKRKNQLGLLAALRETGLPLVLIGQPNPESYRELCRRYAAKGTLFLDPLPQEKLASAYAAAKVHALASWYETPGLASLEAAAAGCNIVSTDRGSAREYFGEQAWYCNPKDLGSIREAVLAAYRAPRSTALQERVRQNYTWRIAARRTLEGYELALSRRPRGAEARRGDRLLRQHAEYLSRLAADREQDLEELRARLDEFGRWAGDLEAGIARARQEAETVRQEMERMKRRRLYRWSEWVAGKLSRRGRRGG
jgi:polysaccharide pyruvyl transferase CsaB